MEYQSIEFGVTAGVATLVFNRPERMNAIDAGMYDEMIDAFDRTVRDEGIRVLVLTGKGERAFCAGADLQARGENRPTTPQRVKERNLYPERSLAGRLLGIDKPVIAAVNGVATGGGLAMALTADMIVISDTARFGTAHIHLAMPLSDMLGWLLPRRVGPGLAADMGLTGRLVAADEALRIGLADRLVPAADLRSAVDQIAAEMAARAPMALHFTKQAVRRGSLDAPIDYLRYERSFFNVCLQSEDAKEAMRARKEKRPPVYHGR